MPNGIDTFADGRAAFFTQRTPADKVLGKAVDGAQTAADAMRHAGLDWTVSKQPVHFIGNDNEQHTVEGKFAIVRDDTNTALGVLGRQFTPVQNVEAFDLCDAIVDESGANYVAAGTMNGGRQVFLSMALPKFILIGGSDAVDLRLMAFNAHDGSSAFKLAVTPVRLRCANQVRAALRNAKQSFSLRHTRGISGKVQDAREALTISFAYVDEWEQQMQRLAAMSYTDAQFDALVKQLVDLDRKDEDSKGYTLASNARDTMHALYDAPTQEGIRGTRWGAFNAVVEYADFFQPVKGNNRVIKLAQRALDGSNDKLKDKAFALLS